MLYQSVVSTSTEVPINPATVLTEPFQDLLICSCRGRKKSIACFFFFFSGAKIYLLMEENP